MFKFLNQGHKLMRIQSSIIAITTLAVLAAVITALALSSFTAEAQGNSGRHRKPTTHQHHRRHPNGLLGRHQPRTHRLPR